MNFATLTFYNVTIIIVMMESFHYPPQVPLYPLKSLSWYFLFLFSERVCIRLLYFFLKCLEEFMGDVMRTWRFAGEFNHYLVSLVDIGLLRLFLWRHFLWVGLLQKFPNSSKLSNLLILSCLKYFLSTL